MKALKRILAVAALSAVSTLAFAQKDGIVDPGRQPYYDAFKDKTISIAVATMGLDLSQAWVSTIRRDLEPLGVKINVRDYSWKPDVGAQALTSMIAEEPDIMVVHNVDVTSFARLIKRAESAGIPVVQLNTKAIYTSSAYVGVDWTEIGERAAETLVKACGEGTSRKVAIMQGAVTDPASTYQLRGVNNVLEKHPEITVVSDQAADWDSSKAYAITTTILRQHPDLCGITGFWDGMDVGIGNAVLDAKPAQPVTVVSSGGGATSACDNVKKGVFTHYVSFNAPLQGHDLSSALKTILQQKLDVGTGQFYLYSKLDVIDKDNLTPQSCWDLNDYQQ